MYVHTEVQYKSNVSYVYYITVSIIYTCKYFLSLFCVVKLCLYIVSHCVLFVFWFVCFCPFIKHHVIVCVLLCAKCTVLKRM